MVLADVLIPVFLLIFLGYIAKRWMGIEHTPVSRLSLYILSPALIVDSLLNVSVASRQLWQITTFTLLYAAAMTLICLAWYRLFRLSPENHNGLRIATVFMNTGNYGFPVVIFAFGNLGFGLGLIFGLLHTVLMYTLGVYFAASSQTNWQATIKAVLLNPLVIAVATAGLLRLTGLQLPLSLGKTINMLGQAGLPLFLVVLGMQLTGVRLGKLYREVALGTITRMILGPLVAVLLLRLLGVTGLAFKVLVTQSAMPSAVIMTLLASEYNARPELVSSITLVTTLASIITVPLTLYLVS